MGPTVLSLVPEMVLVGVAVGLYLAAGFRSTGRPGAWAAWALAACVLATASVSFAVPNPAWLAGSVVTGDGLALFAKVLFPVVGLGFILLSWPGAAEQTAPEYFATLLMSLAGMMLVGSADNLITLFLGLELVSIPTYLLIYLLRPGRLSKEAAAKYFFLGIFASALLLYGLSLLYGLTGRMQLPDLSRALDEAVTRAGEHAGLVHGAMALMVVLVVAGLAYKIAAVPLHFYVPDVYQGAPTPVTALLAFGPKAAGFLALVRLVTWGMSAPVANRAVALFWILAVITMTTGNVLALWQTNIKRMLAYSSIAHAGYMLMGLVAGFQGARVGTWLWQIDGVASVLVYLIAYAAMNLGAFAVLEALAGKTGPAETLDEIAGLGRRRPALAAMMAIFMFSLMGMPLTAGFVGKLCLFATVLAADPGTVYYNYFLAAVGAINTAIGAFYYLRVCARLYLHEPLQEVRVSCAVPIRVTILACALVTLVVGLFPGRAIEAARHAAGTASAIQRDVTETAASAVDAR